MTLPPNRMEGYFDAFLYFTNWGTREVMISPSRRAPHPGDGAAVPRRQCSACTRRSSATQGTSIRLSQAEWLPFTINWWQTRSVRRWWSRTSSLHLPTVAIAWFSTQWTDHVEQFAAALRQAGHDPVVLRGGMGTKARTAALKRLEPQENQTPLVVVATGPYVGEGFDCPLLDTLFLAAPIAFKGRLVQYAGRILRSSPGKTTAEIHDYVDTSTRVLASALAKRAPGYTSLGFPDPRRSIA